MLCWQVFSTVSCEFCWISCVFVKFAAQWLGEISEALHFCADVYIAGAKFEEHFFNINFQSRDILDWMLCSCFGGTVDAITFLICIIQKCELISKTDHSGYEPLTCNLENGSFVHSDWQFWCYQLQALIGRLSLSESPLTLLRNSAKRNGKRVQEEM